MYGSAPTVLGNYNITCEEMLFYMYLPIKFPYSEYKIPERLKCFQPLIDVVDSCDDKYVYLTAKRLYVTPDNMGNRHGWHIDGFGTNDINLIWADNIPTEFCIQQFELDSNCSLSMIQMERQAKQQNIVTYNPGDLLKLNQEQVHRVPVSEYEGMRTFVKISVSDDLYNLKGNSHNYLFDYDWEMQDRMSTRNHPHQ